MTGPPQRPGDRPPSSPGRRQGQGPGTTTQTPAHGVAKPLSPALDTTFKVGLVLKGLDGVLEVAGGILLLFLSPQAIQHLARMLTAHELSEDPHDLIARYLLHTTAHLNTAVTIFGAIYLLSHGIAKIVLVALVLRGKLWAYPWLIVLLLAFISYQLYRPSSRLARRVDCQIRPKALNTRPRMLPGTCGWMIVAKAALPVEVPAPPRTSAVMPASTRPARPRRPNAVNTTMGRQLRVGNRVSRPGPVRAPAAMG